MGQGGSAGCCAKEHDMRPWQVHQETVGALAEMDKVNLQEVLQDPDLAESRARAETVQQTKVWPDVFRFEATLRRDADEDGFGLVTATLPDGGLIVLDFLRPGGAVSRWNRSQEKGSPSHAVQRGDRIITVNSMSHIAVMRSFLLREDSVRLSVERWPETFSVKVVKTRSNHKLGMCTSVNVRQGVRVLQVVDLADGLITEWNHRVLTSGRNFQVVAPGCQILGVDGLSLPAEQLQASLQTERSIVQVEFRRPPPEWYL